MGALNHLGTLHERNVAEVNERILTEGRCVMHNSDVTIPARYVLRVPIGNELPLCVECCAWWRQEVAENPEDEMARSVWIREIPHAVA